MSVIRSRVNEVWRFREDVARKTLLTPAQTITSPLSPMDWLYLLTHPTHQLNFYKRALIYCLSLNMALPLSLHLSHPAFYSLLLGLAHSTPLSLSLQLNLTSLQTTFNFEHTLLDFTRVTVCVCIHSLVTFPVDRKSFLGVKEHCCLPGFRASSVKVIKEAYIIYPFTVWW